jgi:hypothetical protein
MRKMSLKDLIPKTTVANLVAAFCVVSAMTYFIYTKDTNGVMFLAGAGVGYLLKEVKH